MTGRGPRIHRVTAPGGDPEFRGPEGKPWVCTCGTTGDGQDETSADHLHAAAKAAFKRLDDVDAHSRVVVHACNGTESDVTNLLYSTRYWTGNRQLRTFMHPYYDGYGVLAARMDWAALAAALDSRRITAEYESDLLVLRIAASLMGACVVNLSMLRSLSGDNARTVWAALAKQLPDGAG